MFVMPRGAAPAAQEAAFAFLRWMMQPEQANSRRDADGLHPRLAPRPEVLRQDGYYAAHPNDHVAVDQLAHAAPWPWSPELLRVQREAVQPRLEERGARPARRRRDPLPRPLRAAR